MKLIKIISGTYGHNVNGIVEPKTRESEPFYVDDKEAGKLIGLKAAVEVVEKEVATVKNGGEETNTTNNPSDGENGSGGQAGGKNDEGFTRKALEAKTNKELKALCEELNIETEGMKVKADFVDAIMAYKGADDEPPVSGATNPVI